MPEMVILAKTLYGVVYSSPAGAKRHLVMAAACTGSLQIMVRKKAKQIIVDSDFLLKRGECCGTIFLPVKICFLYMFNKMLIGQMPGKKHRQGDHAGRRSGAMRTREFWKEERVSLQ